MYNNVSWLDYRTNLKIIFLFLFTFLVFLQSINAQDRELLEMEALSDTLFKTMSIDELKRIQEIYKNRVDRIRQEEEKIRGKGLQVTESFINREGADIKDQDVILIRVAEYYIEEAQENYNKKVEEYDKLEENYFTQMNLFDEGKIELEPVPPEFPKYDYIKAIEIYDKILNEYPQSDYADDALYTKAYLKEKMDQGVESRRIYQEVIDRYPDSHFAAESYMRLAEYFFDPREDKDTEQTIVEIQKAIKLYKRISKIKMSRRNRG